MDTRETLIENTTETPIEKKDVVQRLEEEARAKKQRHLSATNVLTKALDSVATKEGLVNRTLYIPRDLACVALNSEEAEYNTGVWLLFVDEPLCGDDFLLTRKECRRHLFKAEYHTSLFNKIRGEGDFPSVGYCLDGRDKSDELLKFEQQYNSPVFDTHFKFEIYQYGYLLKIYLVDEPKPKAKNQLDCCSIL
jgi:hypothetical protein